MVKVSGINFEVKIEKIEQIVDKLEKEGVGLTQALLLYEEGVQLIKDCEKNLKDIKEKIEYIKMENAHDFTRNFEN